MKTEWSALNQLAFAPVIQWFLETDLHYRGWYFSETELKQKQKQEKDNERSETTSDAC